MTTFNPEWNPLASIGVLACDWMAAQEDYNGRGGNYWSRIPYIRQYHQLGSSNSMDEKKGVWYSILLNYQTNISSDFCSNIWSTFYNPIKKKKRGVGGGGRIKASTCQAEFECSCVA